MGKLKKGLGFVSFSKLSAGKNRSPYLFGHPDLKSVFILHESKAGL